MRRFEFVGGGSNKFWEISQSDTQVTVHFGRIGTNGQTQTKSFASWDEAAERMRKLVAEKLGEGYIEVEGSGPRPEPEPGPIRAPSLPLYELPQVPGDGQLRWGGGGPLRWGGVALPAGRRLTGDPQFVPMGVAPVNQPVMWATDDRVEDAGRLLHQLRLPALARNLVPVLLEGLESEPNRPWDSHEFCPTDPRRAGAIDVAAELARLWAGQFETEDGFDEERLAGIKPFGRKFPGLSRPADGEVADDADVLARFRGRRIGLVAATRPADVVAAVGWVGAVNVHDDPALISAVLRSWEVRWNARLVELGFDTLKLTVGNPPRNRESALAIAAEHCALCDDNIWQGAGTIAAYADLLVGSRTWEFWWD